MDEPREENFTEINERKQGHSMKPYNTLYKKQIMITQFQKQVHDEIQKVARSAPQSLISLVYEVLHEHVHRELSYESMDNEPLFRFISEKYNNVVMQCQKSPNLFRGVLSCKNSPMELFEEI